MTMPDLVAARDMQALNDWVTTADPLERLDELARLDPVDHETEIAQTLDLTSRVARGGCVFGPFVPYTRSR